MQQDQLTRAERIRLECFAQINQRTMMGPKTDINTAMQDAERLEAWLKQAREDA